MGYAVHAHKFCEDFWLILQGKVLILYRRLFVAVFISLCLISVAEAENSAKSSLDCTIFNAVYEPHKDFKSSLNYRIYAEKNPNYVVQSTPKFYFILESYSQKDNVKLSALRMGYGCSGGSMPSCFLDFKGHKGRIIQVTGLNADFSRNYFGKKDVAPKALIIPSFSSTLHYTNWGKVEDIEYFTPEKVHPYLSVPTVWVKTMCNDNKGT